MACKIIYKGKALPEEEAKIEINNDVVDDLNEQAVGKSIINSALLTDEEINQQITDLNKFKTVIENNYFKLEDNISVSSLVINKHIKNAPASLGKVKIDSKWRTKEEAKKQVEENLKQRKLFSKLKRNFGITEEQLNLIENVSADKAISSAEDLINAIESKLLSLTSLVLNSKKSKSATLQQKEQAKTIEQLFNENPELANSVYEALGFNNLRKEYSNVIINQVWKRLASEGITNADSLIGTRETINNKDFNKFWSAVKDIDIQNVIKFFESEKQKALDSYSKYKGEFDSTTGTFTSNDTSFFDNKIKDLNTLLQQKQQALQVYSQYLDSLNKPNTNPILQNNQQEQVKKFAELQERLNNKEFTEAAKSAYENSEELKSFGTQEQYNDYIARVSLGIIKNPSSGEYNYTSQAKDIVYHGSNETRDSFELGKGNTPQSDKYGIHFTTTKNPNSVFNVGNKITSVLLNIQNPKVLPINNESKAQSFDNQSLRGNEFIGDYDSLELPIEIESKYLKQEIGENNYVVFEPEQIHILGGKNDIEGFKQFVQGKQFQKLTQEEKAKTIEQLFNENPELANAVYEALGFKNIQDKKSVYPILNKKEAINTLKNRVKELEKELLLTFEGKGKRSEFWINGDIRTWEKIIKTLEENDNVNVTNVFKNQNLGKDLSDKKGVEVFELEADNVFKVGVLFEKTVDVINAGKKVNSPRIHPFTEFHWFKNEFAAVATKAKGVPLKRGEKLSLSDIEKQNLYYDLAQIENAGLTIDISKHNNFYYNKGEGIHFIDLGAETITANEKNNNFFLDNFFENTSSEEFRKFKETFKPTNQITPEQKQQAQQLYSQYLDSLNKPNTNPILQTNQEEQVKKFAELQERLNNKEFLKGAKNVFENSTELQEAVYESLGFKQEFNTKGISIKFNDGNWNIILLNNKRIGQFKFIDNGEKGILSLSIQINEDYQNKGYGQIVHIMAADLAEKEYRKSLYSDYQNSEQEVQLLKSLAKKGYAEQTGDIGTESKEFLGTFNTTERAFRIKTLNEINQITIEQKQLALDTYTDYIARVSLGIIKNPSSGDYNYTSQVKDIVYHGTVHNFDKFVNRASFYTKIEDIKKNTLHFARAIFSFVNGLEFTSSKEQEAHYNKIKELGYNVPPFNIFKRLIPMLYEFEGKRNYQDIKERLNHHFSKEEIDKYFSPHIVYAVINTKNPLYTDKPVNDNLTVTDSDSIIGYEERYGGKSTFKEISVFEPEQIHILSSQADIQGFKDFVQGKQFQKLTAEEKAKAIEQITKEHRSIVALKDLAAKLAYRIGGKVEFVNRTDVDWKGYNKGMTSVLNEAYMDESTTFHEILAHPIIKVLKKSKPEIYQSLLKELETSETGRKVFEQVKRDYVNKEFKDFDDIVDISKDFKIVPDAGDTDKGKYYLTNNDGENFGNYNLEEIVNKFPEYFKPTAYTLEEQQEEAIVTLLGMMAADKLDKIKDKNLISLLKELLLQMSEYIKSLFTAKEIRISELNVSNLEFLTNKKIEDLIKSDKIKKEC